MTQPVRKKRSSKPRKPVERPRTSSQTGSKRPKFYIKGSSTENDGTSSDKSF